MPKEIVTADEAAARAESIAPKKTQPETPKPEIEPAPQKPSVNIVTFATGHPGLIYFDDKTTFAFHKAQMMITDPEMINKLTEYSKRPQSHIRIIDTK